MSAPSAEQRLATYAEGLGFASNTALFTRYLDALESLTGRSHAALLAEVDELFRHRRVDGQEYARYFMLPEERLLYGLWLVRFAIERPDAVVMFVVRGAEPLQQAWQLWKSEIGRRYELPDTFAMRLCRGYPGDADPDAEPRHFLSRSIISSLSDDERRSTIPERVREELEDTAAATGLEAELDLYLSAQWGLRGGLHALLADGPATLEHIVVCLADFGIDKSFRRLIWRNRHSRFGTDGVAPLLQGNGCTVGDLSAWVRRLNVEHCGRMFDEEDVANMDTGLSRLTDARGRLPEQCRELISSVMRIYLNMRLVRRLRHATEHKARPLLNILLRSTSVGRQLGRSSVRTVATVDEATVSGTSLIASELAALSFNQFVRHVSVNVAQRTPSTAEFLSNEQIVDASAVGGIWFQEDLSHFYEGFYGEDMRYVTFADLARRLRTAQQRVNPDPGRCQALLDDLNRRLRSFVAELGRAVASRDAGCHVRLRYPIEVILSHIVKLYLRRTDALAFESQRLVLDDDVLQMVSPLQCDFTGWFFLREMRQRALEWLETDPQRTVELGDLQRLDSQVRFFELAQYFEGMAGRHEAGRRELQTASARFIQDLGASVTAFVDGEIAFDALRTAFYERYRWSRVNTTVST